MPVTLDDLRVLAGMVRSDARKLSAVARELRVERTYLYRMIERCDTLLEDLRGRPAVEWREGTHFRPPAELRRLARSLDILLGNWHDYPIISAGTTAASIVEARLDRWPTLVDTFRMKVGVQTEEALTGVASDVIDLAIVQGGEKLYWSDVASRLDVDSMDFGHRELLPWQAVIARTRLKKSATPEALEWKPGSFGHSLTDHVAREVGGFAAADKRREARSYADALLMARHGHPVEFVIPDIYLTRADADIIEVERTSVSGALVAVFRQSEMQRLADYLDPAVWAPESPA